jgi:phosphomannomutase
VGYTFIHQSMVESGAFFGAETSGHVYFRTEHGYTESAAYATAVVLRVLATAGVRLSALVEPLRTRYAQAAEINVAVDDREKAMQRVEERHRQGVSSRLDGLSVEYPDYWFNVRPSNTEPILRVRLEARDSRTAQDRAADLIALIEKGE